ncbi:LacI family DNA-binding transcriptional regulator [Gryllotalpicola daejeonensis]|uniref:LacI family DNA-binding transcriptional regulator n=1 Tax=Gryllotalpicola daejeonensis TaxID=993087 RepID=A0ABP7ZJ94_9MICO
MNQDRPAKSATRAEVAQRAGVSTAVVSYVLTGAKRVSSATEARVRAAIDELGYRPNGTARALRTGRSSMLGIVIPDIGNPYFAEFVREFERAVAGRNFAITVASSHGDPEEELRLVESLRGRAVDGLAVASVVHAARRAEVHGAGGPIVWIDAFDPEPGSFTVGADAETGARSLVEHLIAVHDRRNIAIVLAPSRRPGIEPREVGWRSALRAAGLPDGPIELVDDWTREFGAGAGRRLFTRPDRPDAIFAASDFLGIGLLSAAAELGVSIPDDVPVVSYDGTAESEFSIPKLTTYRQPVARMARATADALIDAVPTDSRHLVFPGELVIRRSCGCTTATAHEPLTTGDS